MTYEHVYTVWDFFDGPRSGVANYGGVAHHFVNEFDEDSEEYTDRFTLRPIDDATLQLIVKQWAIWRAWEIAFHSGQRDKSTHPAFHGQDETYDQLGIEIKTAIATNEAESVLASAIFRECSNQADLPKGVMPEIEVGWTALSPSVHAQVDQPINRAT